MKSLPQQQAKKTPVRATLEKALPLLFRSSFITFSLLLTSSLAAETGARLVVPKSEAWTGQRVPFFVELRAQGSFKGAASFDLPEIPQTVVIKVGNPVLSSETKGDTEVFVQRHEFALFSQAGGTLPLPPITARFKHTKGYTGPSFDISSKTEATTFALKRPPNSESLDFIVTTGSLEIEETWNPPPGPLETGAILKRTIVQRATELTGIALKPAPTPEIEGIKTYTANPDVTDKTGRGDFLGERRETITYLVQQPGRHTLPEIRYDWWNPVSNALESKILRSVSFTATAPPAPPEKTSPTAYLWLLPVVFTLSLIAYGHQSILHAFHRLYERIDPAENRAGRRFLKACRLSNPAAAATTWNHYRQLARQTHLSEPLEGAIQELYATLYGAKNPEKGWNGERLANTFREFLLKPSQAAKTHQLPDLNP